MIIAAGALGTVDFETVRSGLAFLPDRNLIIALAVSGFGIKAGVLLLHVWLPLAHPVAPAPAHWPLFALMGVLGGAGHFALIKAFQRAPAAVVAPFSYMTLLWATGFGLVIFNELPDIWTIAGAAIIAGGGLYILHRERIRRRGSHDPAVNTPPALDIDPKKSET